MGISIKACEISKFGFYLERFISESQIKQKFMMEKAWAFWGKNLAVIKNLPEKSLCENIC